MNDYITRKSEVYLRACQALRRVAPLHKKGNGTVGRQWSRRSSWDYSNHADADTDGGQETENIDGQEPTDGSSTTASATWANVNQHEWNPYWNNSWWHSGWGQGYGNSYTWWRQAPPEPEEALPELLPDFVQGWYLLHDAGLDQMSRNLVMTALQGDFSYMKVAQELRNQFGEEPKKRDFTKNSVYLGEYQDIGDYEDDEGLRDR